MGIKLGQNKIEDVAFLIHVSLQNILQNSMENKLQAF